MGSAFYYLKAEFPKPLKKKEVKRITDFLYEGAKAQNWWQDNRGRDAAYFWPEFEKEFPHLLTTYLKDAGLFGCEDCNGLAGHLDFGNDEECVQDGLNVQSGDTTLYFTVEVWHFAEWDNLANFFRNHFGATDVKWMSDESTDFFAMLDMEENEEIIKNLLSQKEMLPTLMGIHPALDKKISQKLLYDTKNQSF